MSEPNKTIAEKLSEVIPFQSETPLVEKLSEETFPEDATTDNSVSKKPQKSLPEKLTPATETPPLKPNQKKNSRPEKKVKRMTPEEKRASDKYDFIAEEKFGILEVSNKKPDSIEQVELVNGWAKVWVKTGSNEFSCVLMPKTPRTYLINMQGKIRFCMSKGLSEEQATKFFELKLKYKWQYLDEIVNILKGSWAKGLVSAVIDYKRVLNTEIEPGVWWSLWKHLDKSELVGFKSSKEMEDLIIILDSVSGYNCVPLQTNTIEKLAEKYQKKKK